MEVLGELEVLGGKLEVLGGNWKLWGEIGSFGRKLEVLGGNWKFWGKLEVLGKNLLSPPHTPSSRRRTTATMKFVLCTRHPVQLEYTREVY